VFIYKVGLNQASTRRTAKRIPDDDDAKPSEDKNEDEDDETDGDDDDEDGDGDGDIDMDVPQPRRSAATTKRKETPVSHSAPKPKVLRKTIPVGIPDCLDGVKLLFTGTFETMDRVTSIATAKKYGADVVTKLEDTDYIVTGQRIGPKKAKIINELELETIDEQEFFYILENGVSEDKRQRMANKRSADEAEAPEVEMKPKATTGRKRARR
jgi:BRCT domain type II-containing protein